MFVHKVGTLHFKASTFFTNLITCKIFTKSLNLIYNCCDGAYVNYVGKTCVAAETYILKWAFRTELAFRMTILFRLDIKFKNFAVQISLENSNSVVKIKFP